MCQPSRGTDNNSISFPRVYWCGLMNLTGVRWELIRSQYCISFSFTYSRRHILSTVDKETLLRFCAAMAVTKSVVRGIMCSIMEFTFKASKACSVHVFLRSSSAFIYFAGNFLTVFIVIYVFILNFVKMLSFFTLNALLFPVY